MIKEVYYTIEKHNDDYVVWCNTFIKKRECGSCGCYAKFKGTLKECRKYCKDNGITIKRGRRII